MMKAWCEMIPHHYSGDIEIHGEFPYTLKIHHLTGNVPAHVHYFLEYTYVFQGEAIEIINGVERRIAPGAFTLLFPHQVHELRIAPGQELFMYNGAIGLQAFFNRSHPLMSLQGLLKEAESDWHTSYALDEPYADSVYRLLVQMYGEIRSDRTWREAMFVSKLFELFILVDRFRRRPGGSTEAGGRNDSRGGMWTVIRHVYQNFRDPISLSSLAATFGYSEAHISAEFKKLTGGNYSRFLERIRLAHACSLLIGTGMKVTDVCYEAGFLSYPTFARVFSERMGKSPLAYRKDGKR